MFTVVITEKTGGEKRLTFGEPEVTIGRVPGNDVVLPKGNVSKRHSRIVLRDNRFIVVDLKSTNGTYVNGRKITSPLVVKSGDKIYIGDFVLTLEGGEAGASVDRAANGSRNGMTRGDHAPASGSSAVPPLPSMAPEPMADDALPAVLRASTPSVPPPSFAAANSANSANLGKRTSAPPSAQIQSVRPAAPSVPPPSIPPVIGGLDTVSERPPVDDPDSAQFEATRSDAGGPSSMRPAAAEASGISRYTPPPLRLAMAPGPPSLAAHTDLRLVMLRIAREFDIDDASPQAVVDERRWSKADRIAQAKLAELATENPARFRDRSGLAKAATHEAVGFGPLDGLLSDPAVFHIVVERFDRVRVDRGRGLVLESVSFSSPEAVFTTVRRLAAQASVREPLADSFELSLPNGLQVVAMSRGATSEASLLSVRRRPQQLKNLGALTQTGLLTAEQRTTLEHAIARKEHIWIVGPRSRESRLLLAAALDACPGDERVALFERSPEVALGERSALCLRLGAVELPTLLSRVRHFSPERLVFQEPREQDLAALLAQLALHYDGSLVSFERLSAREALRALERVSDADTVLQSVSLLVELRRGSEGVQVSAMHKPHLEATGTLALLPV